MGVIKNRSHIHPVIKVTSSEESLNSIGIRSEPPTPPSETNDHIITNVSPRRRDPALLLQRLEQNPRKRTGARKIRRYDNAHSLQALVEDQNEIFSDPTIEDFKPKSVTPLTLITTDFGSMRIWQYFLSQSEEEQKKYLDSVTQNRNPARDGVKRGISFTQVKDNVSSETSAPSEEDTAKDTTNGTFDDKRSIHPSFSPVYRFSLVDSGLRSVLKRRHLPLGILSHLEHDVLGVFCDDSNAVYISEEISSFERMLLHGICQYNLLKSWSINVGGSRRTKVGNQRNFFTPPSLTLTEFIEKRRQR